MSFIAGELVTETFEYDGGRQVTVYVPPDPPEAVVFAGDGQLISQWGEALEAADVPSTMIVGAHRPDDETLRLHEYSPGFDPERFGAHEKFFVETSADGRDRVLGSRWPPNAPLYAVSRPVESWPSPLGFGIRTSTVRSSALRRVEATDRPTSCQAQSGVLTWSPARWSRFFWTTPPVGRVRCAMQVRTS
jgi:hypothetical protein